MTKRISPYQFEDHREFVRQALKAKGFSYRSFAAKHGSVVSFITLAMTLSKGRSASGTQVIDSPPLYSVFSESWE